MNKYSIFNKQQHLCLLFIKCLLFNVCNLHNLFKIKVLQDLMLQNVQQILQNVHRNVTKCTFNYYKMYIIMLQNVQQLLQNVQIISVE